MKSPIYTTSGYKMYVVELLKRNIIPVVYQIAVMVEEVLPRAMRISDGILAIISNRNIELTKVCEKRYKGVINVSLPLTVIL